MARWSASRQKTILQHGSPLDPALQAFAETLGIREPASVRVEITDRIPLPCPDSLAALADRIGLPVFRPAGMALGRGISALRRDPALLRHELVHTAQYQRLGGHEPFMRRYLFECLHLGYLASPLEIEAREKSQNA